MTSFDSYFRLLEDTLHIPLFDLNYLASSEQADVYAYNPALRRRGIGICVLVFFYRMLKSGWRWRPAPKRLGRVDPALADKVWVVAETKNQYDALRPVYAQLENAAQVSLEALPGTPFPTLAAYLTAILFWPLPVFRFFAASSYQRRSYAYVFNDYWLTYGYYLTARLWLRRLRPRAVVVANDHNMKTRTLVRAAHDEAVPTAYLQHASVTEKFPPLSFTYAFLDGQDALEKYTAIGPSETQVFLAGIPKFDAFLTCRNDRTTAARLGICINLLDASDRVLSLCRLLRARFPDLPVSLRPHPSDSRDWTGLLTDSPTNSPTVGDIDISDAKLELSFAFLKRVDAIIVGDSNITLEALLMNVTPLYYDFSGQASDHYGFVRRGAVTLLTTEELLEAVTALQHHKPAVRQRSKAYCATVDTCYDGRSAQLVARTLEQRLRGELDTSVWQRLGNRAFEAYRPLT